MSFNDMGWLIAFSLAGLSLLQVVKNWAEAKFTVVNDRIEAQDRWFNEEMKSLRNTVSRVQDDLYAEFARIDERTEGCTPADKKNFYNTEA